MFYVDRVNMNWKVNLDIENLRGVIWNCFPRHVWGEGRRDSWKVNKHIGEERGGGGRGNSFRFLRKLEQN